MSLGRKEQSVAAIMAPSAGAGLGRQRLLGVAPGDSIVGPIQVLPPLVLIWVVLCLSNHITVSWIPYGDFLLSLFLLVIACRHLSLYRAFGVLLLLPAIALSGIAGGQSLAALAWTIKLAAIFLGLATFRRIPGFAKAAQMACIVALLANGAMVLGGNLGIDGLLAEASAVGRRGTLLCQPGNLAYVGILPLFYFLYRLTTGRHIACHLLGLAMTLLVIWQDGSRTAYLTTMLAPAALGAVLIVERRLHRLWPLVAVAVLLVSLPATKSLLSETNPLLRLKSFLEGGRSADELLWAVDPTRYELLQHAVYLIQQHPLEGNGFQAAALAHLGDADTEQVVHNAYLQVWANFGLLGVLGLAWIVLGWLPSAPNWLVAIRNRSSADERAWMYNGLFLHFAFAFALLFHPISTEWSVWIRLLVAHALIHCPATLAAHKRTESTS